MKGNGKRLLSMALVCLLCWTVPAQALMAVDLPENTAQTETAQLEGTEQSEENNSVSGSDILADVATLLANNNFEERLSGLTVCRHS